MNESERMNEMFWTFCIRWKKSTRTNEWVTDKMKLHGKYCTLSETEIIGAWMIEIVETKWVNKFKIMDENWWTMSQELKKCNEWMNEYIKFHEQYLELVQTEQTNERMNYKLVNEWVNYKLAKTVNE